MALRKKFVRKIAASVCSLKIYGVMLIVHREILFEKYHKMMKSGVFDYILFANVCHMFMTFILIFQLLEYLFNSAHLLLLLCCCRYSMTGIHISSRFYYDDVTENFILKISSSFPIFFMHIQITSENRWFKNHFSTL